MDHYRLGEVFSATSIPDVTFVQPPNFPYICNSLEAPGKHVTVYGPTGCGKTTLVTKAGQHLGVADPDVFSINAREYTAATTGEAVLATALDCPANWHAIEELLGIVNYLLIDDFHFLQPEARQGIWRRLKLWHEQGIKTVIVGIAQTVAELVTGDAELSIRNDTYGIGGQEDAFIDELISLGEGALNVEFNDGLRGGIVELSSGFPSIAQLLCETACVTAGVTETCQSLYPIPCSIDEVVSAVTGRFDDMFFDRVVGFAKGKEHGKQKYNTYFDIIATIAAEPGSEIPVETLRQKIILSIPDKDFRSKKYTSYYNCLNNLADVIEARGLSQAMRYDENSQTIYITDPNLRFYLRLLDLSRVEQQLLAAQPDYPYDVAVSFAGECRDFVAETVRAMEERGIEVFYDDDSVAEMWGKDLQPYLTEVYANKATYMVVFLSEEYPRKDWPKFELEIGREAQGKRTSEYLLPVRMAPVHVLGLGDTVHYLDGTSMTPEEIADIMAQKLDL